MGQSRDSLLYKADIIASQQVVKGYVHAAQAITVK